ncbi:hypothetical protein [Paraburkholderia ribeironis]|nr:hypothetical protein [Paraburkholderia ribeironis]
MRLKSCIALLRTRRDARDGKGWDTEREARCEAPPRRKVRQAVGLAALIATAGLMAATGGLIASAHGPRANRAIDASQDCSARYAALLDLAELARRDGKSSEVVVRGLSERGGALSGCLPAARGSRAVQ